MDNAYMNAIWARRMMLLAALAGFFASTYLLITYVSGEPITCGTSHGCDIVRASKWATSFGMPRPVQGVAFYAVIMLLIVIRTAMPSYKTRWLYRASMVLVTIGLLESAFLTFVQAVEIKAFCTWCLVSAVAATVLFLTAWWDEPIALDEARSFRELKLQLIAFVIALFAGGTALLFLTIPSTDGEPPILRPRETSQEEIDLATSLLYPEGLTYEGPGDAPLTIVEFVDFQCPACRAAHPELAKIRESYRGRVRFAMRHFPLPTHTNAKGAAIAAACANAQGMFYAYADEIIQGDLDRDTLVRVAAELRLDLDAFVPCLESEEARNTVLRDVKDGFDLGVRETPTIFLNTTMVQGLPSAEQLSELIDGMLAGGDVSGRGGGSGE